jgi:predicted neutral ceramidase superfamily lipid hydrolase
MSFFQSRILNKETNEDIARAYRFHALNLLIAFSTIFIFLYVLEHKINTWDVTILSLMAMVLMVFLLFFIKRKTILSVNPFVARWGRDTAILFLLALISPYLLLLSPLLAVKEFFLLKEARLARALGNNILENLDVFLGARAFVFNNCTIAPMFYSGMGATRRKVVDFVFKNPCAPLDGLIYDEKLYTGKEAVAEQKFYF